MMGRKKFVVHPGYAISRNDWDRHYISAQALMDLYEVHQNECIVLDQWDPRLDRSLGFRGLENLLHLHPLAGPDYRPVSARERELYPL
jgi:hypothetical protein